MITILIPCLNEEGTIEQAVVTAKKSAISAKVRNYEIIVADSGSTDGSIEKIKQQKIARLVKVPVRGYGAALHWGILGAKGEYVFFSDAVSSYDFMEIKKFLKFIHKHYDLILGSRFKGKISEGAMPFLN